MNRFINSSFGLVAGEKNAEPEGLRIGKKILSVDAGLVRQVMNVTAHPVEAMLLRNPKIEIDRFVPGRFLSNSEFLGNPVRCLTRHVIVSDLADPVVCKFYCAVEYCR